MTAAGAAGPSASPAVMRHYLEQLLVHLVMSPMDTTEAVDLVAEVESHCRAIGGAGPPIDPFVEFGPPEDLARRMMRPPTTADAARGVVITSLFSAVNAGLLVLVLALSGVERIATTAAQVTLLFIGGLSAMMSLSSSLPADEDHPRWSAARAQVGGYALIVTAIAIVAIGAFFGDGVPLNTRVAGALVAVGLSGCLYWLWRQRLRPTVVKSPVTDGVTAEIVADIQTASFPEGWVRYGVDGRPLENVPLSEEFRDLAAFFRSTYRKVREALDQTPDQR